MKWITNFFRPQVRPLLRDNVTKRPISHFPLVHCFFLLLLLGTTVLAETGPNQTTLDQVQQVVEKAALSEEERKKALDYLSEARQWLLRAAAAENERQATEQTIQQAPRRSKEIEQLLKAPDKWQRRWPPLNLNRPLEQLEAQLAEEETSLAEAQATLEDREKTLARLLEIATDGGKKIAELEKQLEVVKNEIETFGQPPTDPLQQARLLSLQARKLWLEKELARLRLIRSNLDLLTRLARAERNLASLGVAKRLERTAKLQSAIEKLRRSELLDAIQNAEIAQMSADPQVKPLWEQNLAWWREMEKLTAEAGQLKQRKDVLKRRLEALKEDAEHIRQAIELAGTDQTIARLLYQRLRALPDQRELRRAAQLRRSRVRQIIVRRFQIEEELDRLRNEDHWLQAQLQRLPKGTPPSHVERIRLQLQEVRLNRLEVLHALQQIYTRYLGIVSELETIEQQFYEAIKDYHQFLQRQLIWMAYRGEADLPAAAAGDLLKALSPGTLTATVQKLGARFRSDPEPPLLIMVACLTLLGLRSRAKSHLGQLGQATRSIRSDRFLNTLLALVDTAVLAAPLPLLLFGAGFWLRRHALTDGELASLANGLLLAGRPAVGFGLLRQICRPEGPAHRHLRWLQVTRESLWRQLRWFTPWAIICALVVGLTDSPALTPLSLTLGRGVFVAFMVSGAMLIRSLWRRDGPILTQLAQSRPSWVVNHHPLWFYPALALPLGLALAALAGYYYAAFYLTEKAFRTLWFFVLLVLLKDLLLRAIYLTERRLRYREILRRREELRAKREEQSTELPPVEEPEVDFGRLSDQTRHLLRIAFFTAAVAGLWFIWQEAIPALNILERITLPMTTTRPVGGVPKEVPLTLSDVLTGVFIGVLTILAARNLPGLVEFTILRRLPLDQGARYTWSALIQYLIAAVGIYIIFRALGVQWSEIQWLIAALSVGLGFGLQEVVANFVSGLILLFERPIRVGDVVTVGDVTGTVSRIRIRATTILNWDRQELVIPNKNFITSEFINWTLTDTTNRIVIQVGVAYGSDVEKAMAIVRETARAHPEVLDDPAPLVTFESFSDNSLLILLRAYLGRLDNRLATITDLHRQIYQRLGEAGIEIAFPQRDVHLDTKAPLQVVVRRDQAASSS